MARLTSVVKGGGTALCIPVLAAFVLGSTINPYNLCSAQTETPSAAAASYAVDAEEQRTAIELAEKLLKDIRTCDELDRHYCTNLVSAIVDFYKYGTGAERAPGDELVTREFCREVAMGALQKMVGGCTGAESGQLCRFEHDAAGMLRKELSGFLETSDNDLTSPQRLRLYYLVGSVLTPSDDADRGAVKVLETRRTQALAEVAAADAAIAEIKSRQKARATTANRVTLSHKERAPQAP